MLAPFTPTSVGSLPHVDPRFACDLIARYLPEIPAWPQLPKRGAQESIYAQYGNGFPGFVLTEERVYVDRSQPLDEALERLYTRYLGEDLDAAATDLHSASGLAEFLRYPVPKALAVKGHIMGPISWGLTVTDETRRAILYDDVLADATAKHLRLQAMWQERALRQLNPQTILFIDEPYLAAFGSAYVAIDKAQVIALIEEVLGGLKGLKGIHCCGNTDWGLLLSTSIDILNFDAYNYAENLALYPHELNAFLERGGCLAWGLIPVTDDAVVFAENQASLMARFATALEALTRKGVSRERLVTQALLTPACGLGTLSEAGAEHALMLLRDVAVALREKYQTV